MTTIDIRAITAECLADAGIFSEDSARLRRVKRIVRELPQSDRTILLAYTELSTRQLAKVLGFSHTTIANEIRRIRRTIISRMNDENDN